MLLPSLQYLLGSRKAILIISALLTIFTHSAKAEDLLPIEGKNLRTEMPSPIQQGKASGVTVTDDSSAAPSKWYDTLPEPGEAPSENLMERLEITTSSDIEPEKASDQREIGAAAAYAPDRFSFNYFTGYFIDTGKILISPIRWETKDWVKAGLVAGISTGLYFFADEHVRNVARRNQNDAGDVVAYIGNRAGEKTYSLSTIGGLYLYGHLADDAKARKAALLSLESYAITGLFTQAAKFTTGLHRPDKNDNAKHSNKWEGPQRDGRKLSFFSGHTSSAFSTAAVIAEVYKDSQIIPPLAYGIASMTAFARIYSDAHWSSDVFLAAALGYFTGKAIVGYHKDDIPRRVRLIPEISPTRTVLNLEYSF